ncbi:MAG TPA: DedA family protein [Longimicrobiaceae bacterium]|nr:DedA family protein [Longimicrobiaceae bacterium]
MIDRLLAWMTELPGALVYLVIGVFAALENLVPPVPADVIALFGGFLAGRGVVHPLAAFLVVWIANVGGALLVYFAGRKYGAGFFQGRLGSMLLKPGQVARLAYFYDRHGAKVIFGSRFLPMFRAVVPIFAGTSGLGFVRTAVPIALASAAWYGMIVYGGATAGRNWEEIRAGVESAGRWLLIPAALLLAIFGRWWWKTRKLEHPAA